MAVKTVREENGYGRGKTVDSIREVVKAKTNAMSIHANKQRIRLVVFFICLGFWGLPSSYSLSQVNSNETIFEDSRFQTMNARDARKFIRIGELSMSAESYVRQGQIQKAIDAYTEALQYNLSTFELLFLRGNLFLQQDKIDAASRDFTEAIAIDPTRPLGYVGQALVLWKQGHPHQFIETITKAIELDPSDAKSYQRRAAGFLKIDKPRKALSDLNRALALGETTSRIYQTRIYQNLGIVFELLGRYEDAVTHYAKALALDPSDKASLVGRGWVYGCLEEYDKSIKDFSAVLAKHPEDMEIRDRRAGAYSDAGNFSAALQDLQVAMNHSVTDPYLPLTLAYVYYNLGELAKAKKSNAEALSSSDNHVKTVAYFQEGLFALADGRRDAAESFYQEGLRLGQTTKDVAAVDLAIHNLEDTIQEQKPPLPFRERMLKQLVRVSETMDPMDPTLGFCLSEPVPNP